MTAPDSPKYNDSARRCSGVPYESITSEQEHSVLSSIPVADVQHQELWVNCLFQFLVSFLWAWCGLGRRR